MARTRVIGGVIDVLYRTDFAAVLTKKTSSANPSTLADMATGRFAFQKRHLYFSIVVPDAQATAGRPPRYLQFLSEDGNILEEQELTTNDYYNATGKVSALPHLNPIEFFFRVRTSRVCIL